MVETPGDHGTHKYCKLLLVLRLIPLKILRFKFLQGFVMCFLPIFSEVGSWCLSFESFRHVETSSCQCHLQSGLGRDKVDFQSPLMYVMALEKTCQDI